MTSESEIKPKLLVIGSKSMVGSRFCELTENTADLIQADFGGNIAVDITDSSQVEALLKEHPAKWAILFSAFTDVDGAEEQRNDRFGSCWKINVDGAKNVAEACVKAGIGLIFISTDFVFDGQNGPYSEDTETGPNLDKVSWYGITKIEAEKLVGQMGKHIIVRITYPYRADFEEKKDFARGILENYQNDTLPPMFSDQETTPTFIDDLAPAILLLISKNQTGNFHIASPEITSPYEFAEKLVETFGMDPSKITEGSLEDFLKTSRTPRPVKGGLTTDKISALGFTPTSWKSGIKELYDQQKTAKLI